MCSIVCLFAVNNPLPTRVFHANLTNTHDAATRTMPPGPTTWVMVEACRIHPPLLIHPSSTATLMSARTHEKMPRINSKQTDAEIML